MKDFNSDKSVQTKISKTIKSVKKHESRKQSATMRYKVEAKFTYKVKKIVDCTVTGASFENAMENFVKSFNAGRVAKEHNKELLSVKITQ